MGADTTRVGFRVFTRVERPGSAVATWAQVVQREKGSAADFAARWAAAREGQAPPSVDRLLRDQGCVIVD